LDRNSDEHAAEHSAAKDGEQQATRKETRARSSAMMVNGENVGEKRGWFEARKISS